MPEIEYVIYPGVYVLLNEQLQVGDLRRRLGDEELQRIVESVSVWEAALEEFDDEVAKVVAYREDDGELSVHAFRKEEGLSNATTAH